MSQNGLRNRKPNTNTNTNTNPVINPTANNHMNNSNYNGNLYNQPQFMYQPQMMHPQMFMNPMMMQPNMMQPNMMQPNMMQPNMMQPNMMQPNMMQPTMMQPNMMQPVMVMMMPQQMPFNLQQPPNMMQPIINKGDINVQELVNIYDETEETEETDELNNQIDDKNIDNYEGNVINGLEQRVQENKVRMVNKPVKVNVDKKKEKKEKKDKNEDNILANMLDNALDNVINLGQPNDEKKETYAEFGQNYNNSNVISEIIPIKKVESHFDKDNYPNEVYKAIMLNGKVEEYKANDIHSYSLETHKYIYEHNQQITRTKANKTNGFIYARCSTTNDISIETQRQACFAYAKAMNIKLVSYGYQYDNNVSARNMNNLKYELGFWEKRIPEDGNLIIYSTRYSNSFCIQ